MSRVKYIFSVILFSSIVYACKKEPVDSKNFVEKSLIGSWQVRYQILTVIKNGNDTIAPSDTALISPIDTVYFTKTLKYVKRSDSVNFAADELGEKITFKTSPDSTWMIDYFRKTSFKLVHVRKENIGADEISYITERDYIK
jgi:hypothetical protein